MRKYRRNKKIDVQLVFDIPPAIMFVNAPVVFLQETY
jgi:hypothetical protein